VLSVASMTRLVETRSTYAGGTVSLVDNLLIDRSTESSVEAMRATRLALRGWLGKGDRKVAVMVILKEAPATTPDDGFRKEVAETWSEFEEQMIAHALVNPAGGFMGAAVRGVMTGINLLSRRRFAQRVCATTDEACAWLRQELLRTGQSAMSLDEMIDAVARTQGSTTR
jgi:hypothetical protein